MHKIVRLLISGGAAVNDQGFYAYGRAQWAPGRGLIGVERGFIGQQKDFSSGLIYFDARYYDPELGHFISPDTLVPDPSNLFDYNRYMYTRGNPMKYNDPTGHCAALDDGSRDTENDAGCWEAADEWFATFGSVGYANKDDWHKYFAASSSITEGILRPVLFNHWAPIYRESGIYHARYNPPPQMHPVTAEDQAFERFHAVIGDTVCSTWDCLAIGLDVTSIALSAGGDAAIGCAVASAGAAAGVCVPAAGVARGLDSMVTIAGWGHTADLWRRGQASQLDLDVVSLTSTFSTVPGMGEAAGTVQLLYDVADPFLSIAIPNRQVK